MVHGVSRRQNFPKKHSDIKVDKIHFYSKAPAAVKPPIGTTGPPTPSISIKSEIADPEIVKLEGGGYMVELEINDLPARLVFLSVLKLDFIFIIIPAPYFLTHFVPGSFSTKYMQK